MSSLDTRRILGSTGWLSWISSGFAWLLRLDDDVVEGVAVVRDDGGSEGIKTGLDTLAPIGEIINLIGIWSVGSDRNALFAGNSSVEFESICSCSIDVVGNSSDLFELIVHGVCFNKCRWRNQFFRVSISMTTCCSI